MSWTVRRARLGDAWRIAQINVDGWQAAYRGLLAQAVLDGLDVHRIAEQYRAVVSMPEPAAVFLSVSDEHVAAFCSVRPVRDGQRDAHPRLRTGEVAALYVDPPLLGTGAGHAVHERGVSHLAAAGFEHAVLWVVEANARARRFYEQHGWTCDHVRDRHTIAGARSESAPLIRYSRRLT